VSLAEEGADEDRIKRQLEDRRAELQALLPEPSWRYISDSTITYDWLGLARYWRKKDGQTV
jgi:hypothetical protein